MLLMGTQQIIYLYIYLFQVDFVKTVMDKCSS